VVVTTSTPSGSSVPPQYGHTGSVTGASSQSVTWSSGGAARERNGPCPGFRPGFFGLATRLPLENGVAWRFPARRSCSFSARKRSTSAWSVATCRVSRTICSRNKSTSASNSSRDNSVGMGSEGMARTIASLRRQVKQALKR